MKIKPTGTIEVQGAEIHIMSNENADYISLTDMTSSFDGGSSLIEAWLRNKKKYNRVFRSVGEN